MKVLFLTKYSFMGASSRYRTLQYFPFFETMGVSCTHSPLFGDDYLNSLYQKKNRGIIILKSFFYRASLLIFRIANYDLIVIEKEIFPYFSAIFERYLFYKKTPYLLDYDDAIFHNYDKSNCILIRQLFKNKIPTVIKNSRGVIAGNNYLLEYVKRYKSDKVYYLPTVINVNKYTPKVEGSNEKFIVGWIGSPSTSKNIIMLNNPLKRFCYKHDATIRLIGFDKDMASSLEFPHEVINWVHDHESNEISKFNVGIMPLIDSPFNRGKCGLKLIQYHGCALPVIASPVGVNKKIISHGHNGFLANSDNDWYVYLELLYKNNSLRQQMGERGRNKIEEEYNLDKTNIEYYNIITSFNHHN
ncbi:MAG: glycosyltransferase family 4 protein [Chlorobi bacterium]|nr:glycosyltransferase family 4 protein [Chlorobiota bacterium]